MWRKTTLWLTAFGILSAVLFSTISTGIWSCFWYKQIVMGPSEWLLNLAQFSSILSHVGTSVGAIALIIHLIRVVNLTQLFQEDWELTQTIALRQGEIDN